ncbi:Thiol-disulfide oxidoreductase ResA [bacterium HR24]|nr:Thiol-disulfide oxidoreductase ResA [bacterium HR24]
MGRRRWARPLFALVVIVLVGAAIWWLDYRPQGESSASQVGGPYGPVDLPPDLAPAGLEVGTRTGMLAPDFVLPTLDGRDLRLSDLRGQAVVLNFWATWCSPCRREMPLLVGAYRQFREQGLVVVAVNVQEDEESVRRFAREFGLPFPVALDKSGDVTGAYRLLGLPTTFFIDRQGVVRSVFRGPFVASGQGKDVQEAIDAGELGRRIREVLE